jgi:hypothetical protein
MMKVWHLQSVVPASLKQTNNIGGCGYSGFWGHITCPTAVGLSPIVLHFGFKQLKHTGF